MTKHDVVTLEAGLLVIHSSRQHDQHVIELQGELDRSSAYRFAVELRRVEASDASRIIVDLPAPAGQIGRLSFIDITGLRSLIGAHRRSCLEGQRLMLRRGPKTVGRLFEISGTADQLRFLD